jgi:hypothetical protein
MSHKPDATVPAPYLSPEQVEQIRAELDRVLNSHHFRGSRRCQNLLRHITQQTLAGNTQGLKERSLGVDVFERPPDYDTGQDPVVRATAAEIRKRLAQYYQEGGGLAARIDLQPGSYVAELHPAAEPVVSTDLRRLSWRALAGGFAGAFSILAAVLAVVHWRATTLDEFWAPILKAPGAVLICMGQPIAYNLSSAKAQDAIQSQTGQDPRTAIPTNELVILKDRYVALGDAMCLVRLTSMFQRHGKAYRIRGEQSTSYADIREGPAVLIAAFDNQWTLQAAGQLRYTFAKDSARDTDMVRDRLHPEDKRWKLTGAWPHWDVAEDYAIVSLIQHDANTDRPLVIAAGITQYGTMAAGDFLSDPQYFSEAAPGLPRDWHKKNIQLVLRVPVMHRTPGHPRVVATHVW